MDYFALKSGTDIRGVASEGTGEAVELTDAVVRQIGIGFLCWCEQHLKKPARELRIALGHDSRISAERISCALKAVFADYGCRVFHCGLASTPAMFMAVLELPCDCAIEITASHHPYQRNGLKFFTENGGLESSDLTELLGYAQERKTPKKPTGSSSEGACGDSPLVTSSDFMRRYGAGLRELIKKRLNAPDYEHPLAGFRIVVDAGNGVGGFYPQDVLAPLGADVSGSVFLTPDGMFPGHIPNPENPEAMAAVSKATLAAKADLGIIFDTDVDRGAAVDRYGAEINRNRLVALAAAIALEDAPGGIVVTDSVTSDGLKTFIEQDLKGVQHRFRRGYKNVINEARRLNQAGQNAPLAIETSGHAAFRDNYFLDDGAYLVTRILIKMVQLRREGKEIGDLLAPLAMPLESRELRLPVEAPDFRSYGEQVLRDLRDYAAQRDWQIAPDNHEGLRVSFPSEQGWFLLRLSVHDPIMPLNLESNRPGGIERMMEQLSEFFRVCGYFQDSPTPD